MLAAYSPALLLHCLEATGLCSLPLNVMLRRLASSAQPHLLPNNLKTNYSVCPVSTPVLASRAKTSGTLVILLTVSLL